MEQPERPKELSRKATKSARHKPNREDGLKEKSKV